jgi:cellulose biosynthesis protein BcsQ
MKTIVILSTHEKAAKTTLAINLGAAWQQQDKKVILYSIPYNPKLEEWLLIDQAAKTSKHKKPDELPIINSSMGIDYIDRPFERVADLRTKQLAIQEALINLKYDYFIIISAISPIELEIARQADLIIATSYLDNADEVEEIMALDKTLKHNNTDLIHGIDLMVPIKVDPAEWNKNSQRLLALGDYLGYENMANMIPACERIHDLSKDGKTVWDLSQNNIKNAFRELLKQIG